MKIRSTTKSRPKKFGGPVHIRHSVIVTDKEGRVMSISKFGKEKVNVQTK